MHRTTSRFWNLFANLPENVQASLGKISVS
jgi:hypothetical protein